MDPKVLSLGDNKIYYRCSRKIIPIRTIETLLGFEQPVLWKAWEKSGNSSQSFRFPDVLIWPKDTKISPNDIVNM